MKRLRGGTCYLVLYRAADLRHRSIAIFPRFDRVVAAWKTGQRVSPIFALDGSRPFDPAKQKSAWVLFAGPCSPHLLEPKPSPYCFLSLGLFNLVILSNTIEQRARAREMCKRLHLLWEEWELSYGEVANTEFGRTSLPKRPRTRALASLPKRTLFLRDSVQDYLATISSALSGSIINDSFFEDYSRFDRLFRRNLSIVDLGETERNRLLALANAALSRHISLTFTGTSPILENECHLWSHSLLGVGLASLGIFRLRQFMENIWAKTRISERILALESEPPVAAHGLEALDTSDPFWGKDHLFCYAAQRAIPMPDSALEPDFLPLVTCFSSRDGFRSTAVSLSAPLETIGACNAIQWTLLTLTHEFSHIIVEVLLGHLLPSVHKLSDLEHVTAMLGDRIYPNLLLQLRAFLCLALWKLSGTKNVSKSNRREIKEEPLDENRLAEYINDFGPELNEILTHCFDFQYFYQRDPETYIRSAWSTWSAIPFIRERLYSYLLRCLCALHTRNIGSVDRRVVSFNMLLEAMKGARDTFSGDSYIDTAITIAEQRKDDLLFDLGRCELTVKFARFFLFSETISKLLVHETLITGGKRGGYRFKPREFTGDPIESPLRFIAQFGADRSPNAEKSLWILSQLAFHLNI